MNPQHDAYFDTISPWRAEFQALRQIISACCVGLDEEFKWDKPCYTVQGKNVCILQGFKHYCALMFCKGALLQDSEGLLVKPGNHTQAARQIRFAGVEEIAAKADVLAAYIREAAAVEKKGVKVAFKKEPEPTPEALQVKLDALPALKAAFAALTPGRQRAYILYFSAPKQASTRASRVEQCLPRILAGKGLRD